MIGLILKKNPTLCFFPSLGAAGKRNEEEDLPFPAWRGGELGTHRVRQPWTMLHPITTFHHCSREGGSSLLCQFFFVIFCFLLVFFLFSFLLFFFLFFIFLFLAAPGHLLLLQNKECKINRGGHGAAPGPTQTTAVKQCWGPVAKRKELQAEGAGRALVEATGAQSFPARSEVAQDQAWQLHAGSCSRQWDSPSYSPGIRQQARI